MSIFNGTWKIDVSASTVWDPELGGGIRRSGHTMKPSIHRRRPAAAFCPEERGELLWRVP
jgi:hypothetical protein